MKYGNNHKNNFQVHRAAQRSHRWTRVKKSDLWLISVDLCVIFKLVI